MTDPQTTNINLQVKMQTAQVANNRLNEIFAIDSEKSNQSFEYMLSEQLFQQDITVKSFILV
ncbi:hypothetical protein EfmJHP36_28330 [Enterococcus faecium]|nr:hypothetical protein EfmJHP36_28330 [Enterococcus faecium]